MKLLFKIALILTLIFVTLPITAQTEEVGKIFPLQEAETLFGNVVQEKIIPFDSFKFFVAQTDNYLFVRLDEKNVFIAGDNLKPIYPTIQQETAISNYSKTGTDQLIYHKFSKSKVLELIKLYPNALAVQVQNRKEVLTLQIENSVLELSYPCPPYCE